MKIQFLAALTLFSIAPIKVLAENFNYTLVRPEKPSKGLGATVTDAASTFARMMGKEFSVAEGTGAATSGIVLARASDPSVPPAISDQLKGTGADREPYVLFYESADRLLIVSNDDLGLSHGLYDLLHRLGVRWYLPGEHWAIIPKRDDIASAFISLNELVKPDFRARSFFGTGGYGIATPADPKMQKFPALVERWKQRNRWGGEFTVGGHAWESFTEKNVQIFKEHPEYLAEVKGERGPLYTAEGKLRSQVKYCVSNPGIIKAFADDCIERLRERPLLTTVSVEPSDGGGHCQCAACAKIGNGSPSDRVFHFANEVARQIKAAFPDRPNLVVTLYAYHQHADIPSFDLEPNVYVQAIPSAFQSTPYSPYELLALWGKKMRGRNLGTYDYWILPDSNRDMPKFNYLEKPAATLRKWKKAGLDSFSLETTSAGGPMGIGLWLSSQLAWNTGFDEKSAITEFYNLSFGKAAPPMQRLMERWAKGFQPLPEMLGAAFNDMRDALAAAQGDSPEVQARVRDFANYLQYIRLYIEYRGLPKGETERSMKAREAVKLMWRIHDSSMVQTFRVQWMIRLNDEKDEPWIKEFDMRDHQQPGWHEVLNEGPVKPEETAKWIEEGVKEYGPHAAEFPVYSKKLVPLDAGKAPGPKETLPTAYFRTYGYTIFTIVIPEGVQEIQVRAFPLREEHQARLQFFDVNGDEPASLFEAEFSTGKSDFVIPVPRAGTYELRTLSMNRIPFGITLPALPTAVSQLGGVSNADRQGADLYFYVPKGLSTVILACPGGGKDFSIKDQEGTDVMVDGKRRGNTWYGKATNPEPDRAQIWKIENYTKPGTGGYLEMITVPQALALSPETLLIPEELSSK